MARPKQFPPAIHHHKPSGQARVRWANKDHYLGPFGSPEAQAAYEKLLRELAADRPALAPAGPTVADLVRQFLAYARTRYRTDSTEPVHFTNNVRPLLALFGLLPAAAFGAAQMARLRDAMATGNWMTAPELAAHRRRGYAVGLSVRVLARQLSRVRAIWRWAEEQGMVPPGAWGHLRTVKGLDRSDARARNLPDMTPLSLETARQIAAQANEWAGAMLVLQSLTGMRTGEVRGMTTGQIDRTGDTWVYRPVRHKNAWRGQTREVYLGPECRRILTRWLRLDDPDALLFPYSHSGYYGAVRRAARKAGIKGKVRPYMARFGAAARIAKEYGLEAAKSVLGHKSISQTAHYAKNDAEHAREVAKKTA